jgi:Xaa-Pro dipeptidase
MQKTKQRLKEIRAFMDERKIGKALVLSPENLFYLTGFKTISYSRPIFLIVDLNSTCLIVPALEEEHAKAKANVDELRVYYEHPKMEEHGISPYRHLLSELRKTKGTIGVEKSYFSLSLHEKLKKNFDLVDIGEKIKKMRYVKDDEELDTIRRAGKLVKLGVESSLLIVSPGITEIEIDINGTHKILSYASSFPKMTVTSDAMTQTGIERTIMPHIESSTRKLTMPDIGIHSRQVALNGYRAELERTFFVGKPTPEQKHCFEVVQNAQEVALDIIQAGIQAKEVDIHARTVFQKNGYGCYAIHRTGHGIGIGAHEEPYLKFDEDLVLEENMVFSIEPGIYIKNLGGFRHSDTVIVRRGKCEIITEYPRDIESLTYS